MTQYAKQKKYQVSNTKWQKLQKKKHPLIL